MATERMRNPFQNEADAFRVLVIVIAAAAIVIVAALLFGSTVGFVIGLIAIALGLWKTAGWLGNALKDPDEDQDGA
jgi:hypothetical protein